MSKLDQIRALREDRAARKSSRGGAVSRAQQAVPRSPRQVAKAPDAELVPGPQEAKSKKPRSERASVAAPRKTPKGEGKQGVKPRSSRAAVGRSAAQASEKSAPAVSKPKLGRPRAEDRGKTLSDLKPWKAEKMSRASWYRKRKAR